MVQRLCRETSTAAFANHIGFLKGRGNITNGSIGSVIGQRGTRLISERSWENPWDQEDIAKLAGRTYLVSRACDL